jgi:hypothetical protein
LKEFIDGFGRIFFSLRHEVAVDIHCNTEAGMAGDFLNILG